MQDAKEEVRSRLNIEDVVGEYVQLKRAGRNFKGLSPFSGEKTPSFYVSPDKNIWHDFSSNKGGDVFSFVMEVEGVGFREALELLSRKAGVDLSIYDTKGSQEVARLKKRLLEANDLAAQYYQQSLVRNQHALEYVFKKRGLSKEIVGTFRIGYAPSTGDALTQFLAKKGFKPNELAQAGLTNRYGGDLFRGRMMVPLMDGGGQVIGFTARILADEPNAPKYLNTPQTLLYDKGRHVFGLSQAKESIRTGDYAVIVEGNLDVVSSHQAGITQVVATAGTALTENHLKALVRLSSNVRLSFDGDKAGLAATERAVPIAQAVGVELSIVSLPDGAKDPDELIKQNPALWTTAIEAAEPVVDWVLKRHAEQQDLNSAAGKRLFTTAALTVVRALRDPVEREHYLQKIAALTGSSLQTLAEKLSDTKSEEKQLKPVVQQAQSEASNRDDTLYQDNLLALVTAYPEARTMIGELTPEMLHLPERQELLYFLQTNPDATFDPIPKGLQEHETYVKIVLLKADARYGSWNDADRSLESARLVRQVITEHKQIKKDQLVVALRDAESSGDEEQADALRQQLNTLIKEIMNGKK